MEEQDILEDYDYLVNENQERQEVEYIPKLKPLYTIGDLGEIDLTGDSEYIELKGGRGGGKSETVAQILLLISRVEATRILCTREIQNSMKDSVHRMLVEWIGKLGLGSEFHITRDFIRNIVTGTDFIFMGMESAASNRADTLKSLKGVKYVWYEEAQTATMESLEKLDPTIRINGRKLIFTMNPRSAQDAVVKYLELRDKVYRIYINYVDNPFCPKVLIDQAEQMKKLDYEKYLHVWMGHPLPEDSSRILLPYSWLSQCVDLHLKINDEAEVEQFKIRDYKSTGGFDIAEGMTSIHDKNALAVRSGPIVTHCEEWQIDEVYKSVKYINKKYLEIGFQKLWFDAVAVGVAAKSEFDRIDKTDGLPYDVYPFKGGKSVYGPDVPFTGQGKQTITNKMMFSNAKAQSWWNIRLRLENSMKLLKGIKIDKKDYFLSFSSEIKDLDSIFLELAQATFDEDNSDRIKIDKAPGIKTVQVEGKDRERKSPNKADAIVYAFAGDLERGLQAHRPKSRKAKVIG